MSTSQYKYLSSSQLSIKTIQLSSSLNKKQCRREIKMVRSGSYCCFQLLLGFQSNYFEFPSSLLFIGIAESAAGGLSQLQTRDCGWWWNRWFSSAYIDFVCGCVGGCVGLFLFIVLGFLSVDWLVVVSILDCVFSKWVLHIGGFGLIADWKMAVDLGLLLFKDKSSTGLIFTRKWRCP